MGYFEMTMHVLHLGLIFHLNLQYLHLHLLVLIGVLGFRYNTCIHTYLYQLEFWGLISILTLVLTSTNWNFGA